MDSWYTKDGTREVTPIKVDGGRGAFKVRNPQHVTQFPDETGIVRAQYTRWTGKDGKTRTVLAKATVAALAALGVDMAELVTERPANACPAGVEEPEIKRQPGESAADWNRRKYGEGIGALLGGIANSRKVA